LEKSFRSQHTEISKTGIRNSGTQELRTALLHSCLPDSKFFRRIFRAFLIRFDATPRGIHDPRMKLQVR
jgi:hypothetical protein